MEKNDSFFDLISSIKNISLNHTDLMDVGIEYATIYFRDKKEEEDMFDKFWTNTTFLEQVVIATREGLVLGMQAIILNKDIDFEQVVLHCTDKTYKALNETKITSNINELQKIQDFLVFLRKEIFSRTYSKNKELQKSTDIPKTILQSRYDYFMNQAFL